MHSPLRDEKKKYTGDVRVAGSAAMVRQGLVSREPCNSSAPLRTRDCPHHLADLWYFFLIQIDLPVKHFVLIFTKSSFKSPLQIPFGILGTGDFPGIPHSLSLILLPFPVMLT